MAFSDVAQWGSIAVAISVLLTMLRMLLALSDRLNKSEDKADAASILAVSAKERITELEIQVVNHRVAVAKEYVSNTTLILLENRMIDAINRLGDRLDQLLQVRPA